MHTADGLLRDYRQPDVFFAGKERTLLANGADETFTEADGLAGSVAERLAESEVPVALGAIPFTGGEAAVLIPKTLRAAGPLRADTVQVPMSVALRTGAVPGPDGHRAAVAEAVRRIRETPELRKVVLARTLETEFAGAVPTEVILRNLVGDNPFAYHFATELPGATFVGASPELLVSRNGTLVRSHPLAGSARRSADPVRDKEAAAGLLSSKKDRGEHAIVVEQVVETLRPFCRKLDVPAEPSVVGTPVMWHIGTEISGRLRDPGVTALELAQALHPTPAVCGTPTAAAREVIGELECFDRGYYAGAVGWVDEHGDGEWAVAIRCAEIAGPKMRLFAGGGIVADSEPDAELDETEAKFGTLLRAMGGRS
ncbi:isochorismate synthase [Amycolatopsis acidicola]|nr:isochorismate synthase [Amycolatopsis acidicola]